MEFLLEERKGNQGIPWRERVDTHNWFEALEALLARARAACYLLLATYLRASSLSNSAVPLEDPSVASSLLPTPDPHAVRR